MSGELEVLFENSIDLLAVADLDGYFKRLSPSWERVLGWTVEEILARPWLDFVHPDDRQATIDVAAKQAKGAPVLEFENRYRCKDGTWRWLSWRVAPPASGSTRLYAIARDLTERKQADDRVRLILEAAPSAMVLVDGHGKITFVNSQAEKIFGYSRAEMLGQFIEMLMPASLQKTHVEIRNQFLANPRPRSMGEGRDLYGRRKDGTQVPLEIGLNPITIEGETFVLAAIVDISERKRRQGLEKVRAGLEAALEERERYAVRLVARSAVTAILSEGESFEEVAPRILKAVCESMNWAHGEVWTVSFRDQMMQFVRGWHLPNVDLEEFENAARGAPWPVGTGIAGSVAASGKAMWFEDVAKEAACPRTKLAARLNLHGAFAFPVASEDKASAVMMFFSRKIEKPDEDMLAMMADLGSQIGQFLVRHRLRGQLEQSQKVESIGRLAGGIAHDFNNLLTVINGYSETLIEQFREGNPVRESLKEILAAGDRAADLTRQLLAFSRNQILVLKVIDINVIVQKMEQLLKRLIGEDVDLRSSLAPGLHLVKADPGQLEQIIMNLAVNARDAMPNGGRLTLETANVQLDEAYSRAHTSVAPGSYVMLAVSDNGIGMDRNTQEHLFEPFFTTKVIGKGTGLGLATVHGIVKQSGANIWVYSEPGIGTTFKIYFPSVQEAASTPDREAPRDVPRGSEGILVVEDEPAVRKLACAVLRSKGYVVLEAASGPEAIEVFMKNTDAIRLLVTDVVMPGLSGRDLHKRLSEIRPGLPVLYVSGYTSNAIVHHGVLDQDVHFLQKPFTADGLARRVRETLDAM